MRKILNIMAIALAIFCRIPVEVHGQSFLKKLKQKVGNVVGTKDDTAEIGEEPFVGGDGDQPTRSVTPTDKLQKRRTATATWDEMIAPSRANSPEALLNELPPLPSVESIVYPEETARATYYRKIVAVDMRITELDSIHTCSDEEMIALRDKFYVELADINGITVEEMKSLEDPNLPEAEKERLIEKMKNALVGDTRGLEAMGADLEKREAAKGGKLTNEEKMAFLAENQGNLSDLGSMMEKMQATNEKTTAFNAKFVKLEQMTVQQTEKMKKILQASDGAITSCEKIAGEYESELKTLYAQIYETDDSQKVEELYARADERMKNYRLRAAKLWRNSLQTQLDGVKAMYPDIVTDAEFIRFNAETAGENAKAIVKMAIDNFKNRKPELVHIPQLKQKATVGYSVEAIVKVLDGVTNSQVDETGTTKPLLECITSGVIRGAVAMVGCNNPKIRPDYAHIELMKKCIANDIVVIASGCSAQAAAKAGLMDKSAKDLCGAGLKRVCELADIPPVLHMGSCVDISRMMILAAELAKDAGLQINQLPVVGCAPEWMSEKAVSIGNYVVGTGIDTFLGVDPYVSGSSEMGELLTEGTRKWTGAAYTVETDIEKLVDLMIERIEEKRTALGI